MAFNGIWDHLGEDGSTSEVALFGTEPSVRMAHDEVDGYAGAQHLFANRVGLRYEILRALDDICQEISVYLDGGFLDVDGWE